MDFNVKIQRNVTPKGVWLRVNLVDDESGERFVLTNSRALHFFLSKKYRKSLFNENADHLIPEV